MVSAPNKRGDFFFSQRPYGVAEQAMWGIFF
jgi:hypothetical protein